MRYGREAKRGDLCYVGSKRYVQANNHYLDDYDDTQPESYLMYWDANNLYGGCYDGAITIQRLKNDHKHLRGR